MWLHDQFCSQAEAVTWEVHDEQCTGKLHHTTGALLYMLLMVHDHSLIFLFSGVINLQTNCPFWKPKLKIRYWLISHLFLCASCVWPLTLGSLSNDDGYIIGFTCRDFVVVVIEKRSYYRWQVTIRVVLCNFGLSALFTSIINNISVAAGCSLQLVRPNAIVGV